MIKTPPLVSHELTHADIAELEEDTYCSAGLMCAGLRIGNYPAQVGWYLEADYNGYDHARTAYSWRFDGDPLGGIYCEDCVLEIEAMARGER
jgi:hypothetical protein